MENEEGEPFIQCGICRQKCYKIHGKYYDKQCFNGSASFFTVVLGDFAERLRIPPVFASQLMNKKDNHVVLQGPSGHEWVVRFLHNTNNTLEFRHGWKEFATFHSLQIGDILVFHYVENSYLEVGIYGRSGCEKNFSPDNLKIRDIVSNEKFPSDKMYSLNQPMDNKSDVMELISDEENRNESEAVAKNQRTRKSSFPSHSCKSAEHALSFAAPFTSDKPFCRMAIKSWNVNTPYMLEFRGSYKYPIQLPRKKSEVLLLNGECKEWKVICIIKNGRPAFSGGWRCFTRDNNIKEGDICIFEQLNNNQNKFIFRVHIFPIAEKDPLQEMEEK